jgi:rhomboid family protein
VIPLRDDVPSRTFPIVNYCLIGMNVALFLAELGMGDQIERFFMRATVIPALFSGPDRVFEARDVYAAFASDDLRTRALLSMFLHGGIAHLLGNMLYLWIFGDNVEDRCGHFKYLIFYLLCGYIATFAHIAADPRSRIPSLGASGAIAGVLGAYMTLFPHARVVTILPLGFLTQVVQLPAVFFLGFWFLQQFLLGLVESNAPRGSGGGGVAWWAHIGGFVAGLVLVWVFQSRKRRPAARDEWWGETSRGRRVRGW